MASKKENLKSLFSNTRTRVIIVFTLVLLILTILIGYIKLRNSTTGLPGSSAVTEGPVGIRSIPGAQDPTAQYVKLQEQQNISQAKQAQKSGGSAIPTIIKTQTIGQGVGVIGSTNGESGIGFTTLSREEQGPQNSLWIQSLKNGSCSKKAIEGVVSQGAQLSDVRAVCTCIQLKDVGYALPELDRVCKCRELKAAGYNARQLKEIGYTAARLRDCGFDACELRNAGFTAQEMKDGGFTDGELKGAGFPEEEISQAGGLPEGIAAADVLKAGCDTAALANLRKSGVSAAAIRRISGCKLEQLKAAGYSAKELKAAGFSAAELKRAGFSANELKAGGFGAQELLNAGYSPEDLVNAGFNPEEVKTLKRELPPGITLDDLKNGGCDEAVLKKARAAGASVSSIKNSLGCSAQALKDAGYTAQELKDAGFTAAELKALGWSAQDLKAAGFSPKEIGDTGFTAAELKALGFGAKDLKNAGFKAGDLKAAGFNAKDLKDAGFNAGDLKAAGLSAQELKAAGFNAGDLKAAGYNAKDLKDAGFSAGELKTAGFNAGELKAAGFGAKELKDVGFSAKDLAAAGYDAQALKNAGFTDQALNAAGLNVLPGIPGGVTAQRGQGNLPSSNKDQLQAILDRQNQQQAELKYQQKIQQKTSDMLSAANQAIQGWKQVNAQVYTEGNAEEAVKEGANAPGTAGNNVTSNVENVNVMNPQQKAIIKTGDILFAVIDTSVNSDEPGPILATVVSGKLKGTKLIGSFNLPSNANKMVISFNTMSVPGAARSSSISAFAIDANTARTALSSRTDHHYLMRYGSLFASAFLQGFGNAFQSANTTVTIGGTGGGNNVTISNGVGRSALENAVIGLAQVGQNWSQQAQQLFNTPTTVEVYSGTGIGVLFTQDVQTI